MFNWLQPYYYHEALNTLEDDDFQHVQSAEQPGDNINSKEDNGGLESCFNATVDCDTPPVQVQGLSKINDYTSTHTQG